MKENTGATFSSLELELAYRTALQDICNKINAAENLDEILIDLKFEITSLFNAVRLTFFVYDGKKRELVSRFKSGSEIAEIHIPVSADSIAGAAVLKNRLINIQNAHDPGELTAIDPDLKFDDRWDKRTGFTTHQVLVCPIVFKKYTLGAIQLINRSDNRAFTRTDETSVAELAKILGIALYNQKRIVSSRTGKFDYLLKSYMLTAKELEQVLTDAGHRKEPAENILISDYKIPKSKVLQSISQFYGVPGIQFDPHLAVPVALLAGLKPSFLRNNGWVPLGSEQEAIRVAVDNPFDLQKIDEIKTYFSGQPLRFSVALQEDILKWIDLFAAEGPETSGRRTAAPGAAAARRSAADGAAGRPAGGRSPAREGIDELISRLPDPADTLVEEVEPDVNREDSLVARLVNRIIQKAVEKGASDIHIEPYPGKQDIQVRTRVDGGCIRYKNIPHHYGRTIVSRIKIMADLDIAERRKPQDGKIRFRNYGGQNIEIRVAAIPTVGGHETIAMRILADSEPIPLDRLGFSKQNYDRFKTAVSNPYGLILVCGPTGSGKTTTLHSGLGFINRPETKIWTAEDPVEITQRGLSQVQVNPRIGFDFAAAMRAFLRADPDVIMVGEMRDRETMQMGIEASLTGHLVLSTLHTNNAPESIARLLNLGMDPFNFADAMLCVLAQRLVVTLCPQCRRPYHPSRSEYDELVREYGAPAGEPTGLPDYSERLTLYRPSGCKACSQTGYKGRMGLHELLVKTPAIKALIENRASIEAVRGQAQKDGMTTLKQDGIQKIFSGQCDLRQVRKVCIV